jgi:hypothetical protein
MSQFGLTQQRALQLMYGLTTPIGGKNNGTMTIGQWAKSFNQRLKTRQAKQNQKVGGAVGGTVGYYGGKPFK